MKELLPRRRMFLAGGAALALLGACRRGGPASCTDVSGLSESEIATRNALAYVDRTPTPGKTCDACVQWIAPADSGQCGGCKLMKGLVHPQGYCNVFAPK